MIYLSKVVLAELERSCRSVLFMFQRSYSQTCRKGLTYLTRAEAAWLIFFSEEYLLSKVVLVELTELPKCPIILSFKGRIFQPAEVSYYFFLSKFVFSELPKCPIYLSKVVLAELSRAAEVSYYLPKCPIYLSKVVLAEPSRAAEVSYYLPKCSIYLSKVVLAELSRAAEVSYYFIFQRLY